MKATDDILFNLVEWINHGRHCAILSCHINQPLERAPTQQQPSLHFLHPNLRLDVDIKTDGSCTRVLRNKGTTIASGSSVMCIPTISVTSASLTLVNLHSDDLDDGATETHALAWYLSQKPCDILPYLDSLPASSDLPRSWPEHTLEFLLSGSPILKYIKANRQHVQLCYKQSIETTDETQQFPVDRTHQTPTWDDYSYSHTMVTSRAFCYDNPSTGKSSTNRVASLHMVPVLDLCNHCRGGCGATNDQNRKNVSYTFRMCHDEVADTLKNTNSGTVVDVIATKDILPNESIRITYGAKPNSVLLVNYGFTIPNNMEPDGSSNDVLEFYAPSSSSSRSKNISISDESPITILRTGPPSYTYGCFTTALQSFFVATTVNCAIAGHGLVNNDDDMEQFLNDCDEECDDDDDDEMQDDDAYFDVTESHVDLRCLDSSRHNASDEMQALQGFREYLLQLVNAYTLPKTATVDWSNFVPSEENSDTGSCKTLEQSRQIYAAIMIYSEIRILQFYIWATERLQNPGSTLSKPMLKLLDDDIALMHRQVDDLVSAYKKLRH